MIIKLTQGLWLGEPSEAPDGYLIKATNVSLDKEGVIETRRGYILAYAIGTQVLYMFFSEGDIYAWAGTACYKNGVSIVSPLTAARPEAIRYNAYNSSVKSVYFLNGTDRKRIEGSTAYEWGTDAPTTAPTLAANDSSQLIYSGTHTGANNLTYLVDSAQIWIEDGVSINDRIFNITDGSRGYVGKIETQYDKLFPVKYFGTDDGVGVDREYVEETVQTWELDNVEIEDHIENITDGSSGEVGYIDLTNNRLYAKLSGGTNNAWNTGDLYITYDYQYYGGGMSGGVDNDFDTGDVYEIRTGLKGTYQVVYTFVRKEGSTIVYESNESPIGTVDVHGQYIDISDIEVPTDSQITHIRIYRTVADGADFYYDQEIATGVTTATSSQEDSLLDDNDMLHDTDHSRPPLGTFCAGPYYNGYCFIGIENLLHWCLNKRPEYWPIDYYVEVGEKQDPIMGITSFRGTVFTVTKDKIFQIQGTGSDSFMPLPVEAYCGTLSTNAIEVIPEYGILHLGMDGIYIYNGNDAKYSILLDPIFNQTSTSIPNVALNNISNCWIRYFRNNVYFGYPSGTATYPNNILKINMANKKITHYDYDKAFSFVVCDKYTDTLYASITDGNIVSLESGGDDNGTAIDIEVESKQLNLPTRKYSPTWVKYDTYCINPATLSGLIKLDEATIQTHSLTTLSRSTDKRLIAASVGNRVALNFTGSGNVKIYSAQELE